MKKIKRFLSLAIGFAMLVSVFTTMTAVSAVELGVYDPNYDFAKNGYNVIPGMESYVELLKSYDGYKNVIHVSENTGNIAIASNTFDQTLDSAKYNFSFDFKSDTHSVSTSSGSVASLIAKASSLTSLTTAADYNHWQNRWSFGTDSVGMFMRLFYINGATELENEDLDKKYGTTEKGTYQNNVWYHIDCVYDYTSTPKKVRIYCDGKEYASRDLDDAEKANAFMLVCRQQNYARGDVYFSNIKVNALGNQKITAEYDSENSTDSAISVKFSEKISDASGLKVVDSETLETVATGATVNGLTATIPVSNLKYGAEYRVSIPAGLTGELGGKTEAQEICFNTADEIGTFTKHDFEDNFDSYDAMLNAGSEDSTGLAEKWPLVLNVARMSGLGRFVWNNNGNKMLRIDGYWYGSAKSVKAWHQFDQAYTTGRIEYNFDMAVNDPNDTKYMTYTFGLHRGTKDDPDSVFDISDGTIKLANEVGNNASPELVTKLTMSNGLSDMVSFKVVEDLTNKKIKTYAKINGEYELLNSNPEGATISSSHYVGGTTGLDFKVYKSGGSTLNTDTSMLVDNVTVDIGEPPMSAVVKKVRLGDNELTSNSASAATTDINVYFNQAMKEDTLNNITVSADGSPAVDKEIEYDSTTHCATLKLKAMLKATTKYTINVPTSVQTADGNALAREYKGVFTTGEGEFSVTNPTLFNKTKNEAATKANTAVSDVLTSTVSVVNQTGESGNLVLILAAYDGDKLIDLIYDPKTYTAADSTFELTTSYTVPANVNIANLNVQVMLWNGFEKMMPVKGAITLQ